MKAMNMLLVDDEESFLVSAGKVLRRKGIVAFTANSGNSALSILNTHQIDIVILDVKMPGMDGIETLERMKKEHPDIKVILLTGHATTESAEEGMRYGASGYLIKPVDLDELLEKAENACGHNAV